MASSTSEIRVRLATYADLPTVARISAVAFHDDTLFGELMHPRRAEFPADYAHYFTKRARKNWWDYNHVLTVAVATVDGREVIAGVAEWERMGSVAVKMPWWDPRTLMKPAVSHLNTLSGYLYPNRAQHTDPKYADPFYASFPHFAHHWAGPRADSWFLDLCCVDPAFQRRGVGGKLVRWGLRQAARDGVCASVISSPSAQKLYERCGMSELVGWASEGEGNLLKGIEGGAILFSDGPVVLQKEEADEEGEGKREDAGAVAVARPVMEDKLGPAAAAKAKAKGKEGPVVVVQEVAAGRN